MSIGVLFWLLMIIWLLLSLYWHRSDLANRNYSLVASHLIFFILLTILGWAVFGPILK